jgi:hypothetical protein
MRAVQAHIGSTQRLPALNICPEQMAVLDLYGQDAVAFQRSFVDIAGGVVGALWLSHALSVIARHRDESFVITQEECEAATGLTRRQQETARQRLRTTGILTERRCGRQLEACLNLTVVANLLVSRATAKATG